MRERERRERRGKENMRMLERERKVRARKDKLNKGVSRKIE